MNPKHGEPQHFCHGGCSGYAEGGTVMEEKKDPSIIPDDIKEFVKKAHKDQRESRPDENWRITPPKKPDSIAPYKKDEESEDAGGTVPQFAEGGVVPEPTEDTGIIDKLRKYVMAKGGLGGADDREYQIADGVDPSSGTVKNYDEGGEVDSNAVLQSMAPQGSEQLVGAPPIVSEKPTPVPSAPVAAQPVVAAPDVTAPAPPKPAAPTDQDYMTKASNMLGLNPSQQAGFMNLLGRNSQKGQFGAAIAGIGDAIASGGTLGKVNPGALAKSEDLIQDKQKAGLEGMQTLRGNQEKTVDLQQKLEANDPNSPLSKWAQKAYGNIGKKLGLDLSHASASLIGDVAGKGVEELNTQYEGDIKQMGLQIQKAQLEATKANQQGQRAEAEAARQGDAAKTLASRGFLATVANALPFTAGRAATKVLKQQALGSPATNSGPVKVNSMEEYKALPSGTHYVDSYGTEKVKK